MKRLSVIARKKNPSVLGAPAHHSDDIASERGNFEDDTISAIATRPSLSSSSSHSRFYFSFFIFNSTIYDCRVSRKRVQFSRRARGERRRRTHKNCWFLFLYFPFYPFTGAECCCYGCAWFPPNISHFILTRCRRRHVYVPTLCRLLYLCPNHNVVVVVLKVAKQQQQQNVNREIKTKRVLAILRWNYIESS